MRFADPIWLFVGAASVTVLAVLLARAELLRTRALRVLAGTRLRPALGALPSKVRRWLRVAVVSFAVAMGFVALARPQKGMQWETVERKGADVLLVVDTSRSMDVDDVKPTRLERAKLAIRDLVERFPGDRVGLVAFAGARCPGRCAPHGYRCRCGVAGTSLPGQFAWRSTGIDQIALQGEPGYARRICADHRR